MEGLPQEKYLEYVLMPWEDETTIIVSESNNTTQAYSRWELIQKELSTSKISNVEDLVNVFRSYNVEFQSNRQQKKLPWKCPILYQYFSQIDESEKIKFFEENGVLSTIRHLTLKLKELVPKLKLLKTGSNMSLRLHQLQIASILSSAFFCIFPKGNADCPSINFNTLYEGSYGSDSKYYTEKIKCLIHYFRRIHKKQPSGNLSFHRLNIPDHKFPRWDKTTASLCSLQVDVQGKIEDQQGFLQMDFANKYVGGGVLGRGCVQEEIRFLISPELIAARLFTECLADNESIFIVGAERYCDYTGYSNTFSFAGDYEDSTPFDENRHRKTYLIILDALYFHNSSDQYRESKILRELKKAYVGFKSHEEFKNLPLATGNWGCGAFGGDPQLKSLLQLMASSQAHRNMLYLTFGNFLLKNQLEEVYNLLKKKSVTVGTLYRIIRLYNRERKKNQTVFEFVTAGIRKEEERKFSNFAPSTSKEPTTAFEFSPSPLGKGAKRRIDNLEEKKKEIFSEMDIETLEKKIYEESETFTSGNTSPCILNHSSSELKSELPKKDSFLLDLLWYENEHNCFTSSTEHRKAPPEKAVSHFEEGNLTKEKTLIQENSEKYFPSTAEEESKKSQSFKSQNKIGNDILKQPQRKKVVQAKITDCFFKK